ncbi:MAG: TadE/TadG family type IV pilus assembly protein [Anaerolineae bacterium]
MNRGERGQSVVELALLLPVLLLIFLGTTDFGRVYFAKVAITNAARVGARYGSLNPDAGNLIVSRTVEETAKTVSLQPTDVQVTCDNGACNMYSEWISVETQYQFQTLFFSNLAFVRDFFPPDGSVTVRASAIVPVTLPFHG